MHAILTRTRVAAACLLAAGAAAHAVDFGPNVIILDPSQGAAAIQSQLDQVFASQETNQFGDQRYALLFKPGTYDVNANVGFYTAVSGLGRNVGDVTVQGVTVDAGWFGGNATQNFWRSVENLTIAPPGGFNRWAVAQAAPMRRVDVRGELGLAPSSNGWASGGYIADSRVSGTVQSISQQQWLTRDSQIGGWSNGVWNMVFSGVVGAPAQGFPNPVYTTLPTSPVTREKPWLYLDSGGQYEVFVPALRHDSRGTTWATGSTPGTSIPIAQFDIIKPGATATQINKSLKNGKHLLFTPGVYHLDKTLNVGKADTVVLGLGYATLVPDNGVVAMKVADVDGVKIAGLLFDAGTTNSPSLLQVGPGASAASHASDPTSIQDVFFRIGGARAGSATTSLVVNSHDVLIDHIWAWRADHGNADTFGWTVNPADQGVVVNGDNVTAYGLFVEHYKKFDVTWNGNGGRTVFFQNEMPYDPPSQSAWRTGANGYAAYKVGKKVTTHEAWGLGAYCFFNVDPSIHADRGFEVPDVPGVKMHDLSTVSLGGNGTIDHVINSTGAAAQGAATVPVTVTDYPAP